jgi:hypothetical protein
MCHMRRRIHVSSRSPVAVCKCVCLCLCMCRCFLCGSVLTCVSACPSIKCVHVCVHDTSVCTCLCTRHSMHAHVNVECPSVHPLGLSNEYLRLLA